MFKPFAKIKPLFKAAYVAPDDLVCAYGILMPNRTKKNLNIITFAASIGILFTVITGFPAANPILTAFYKNELQMGDGLLSVIMAIPQLAVIVQIPLSMYMRRSTNLKRLFMGSALLVRSAFVVLAIIAFLSSSGRINMSQGRITMLGIIALSSLSHWVSDISLNTWLGIAIPYQCRGRYLSTRQMIFTFTSLVFVFALLFIAAPLANVSWQYGFYFLLAAIFGIIDILLFALVHYESDTEATATEPKQRREKPSLKAILLPLRDKNYRSFLGFVMVWYFGVAIPQPFFNVHMNNYMNLSLGLQTLLTTGVTAVGTVLFIRRMGRASDHYGYRNMLLLTAGVAMLLPLIWLFISPSLAGLIVLANFLSGIFFVSTDMNVLSMSIFLAPEDKRPYYLVGKTLAQALLATVPGMLLGGFLMERLAPVLEKAKLPFLSGQTFLPFHVVLLLSFFLRAWAVLVFARKIKKNPDEPGFKAFLADLWQISKNILSGFNRRLRDANWFRPRKQHYVVLGYHPIINKLMHRFPLTRKILAKRLLKGRERVFYLARAQSLKSEKLTEAGDKQYKQKEREQSDDGH